VRRSNLTPTVVEIPITCTGLLNHTVIVGSTFYYAFAHRGGYVIGNRTCNILNINNIETITDSRQGQKRIPLSKIQLTH
jgi:hypothetical protein